jgi:chitodextrinase
MVHYPHRVRRLLAVSPGRRGSAALVLIAASILLVGAGGASGAVGHVSGAASAAATGTFWYVDPVATGSNSGTSWANAWTSTSNVNWSLVHPGDTVYLSGGSTSQTYASSWSINASGTATAPITIAVDASSPAHSGRAVFDYNADGNGSTRTAIKVNGNYVTLSGNVGGANHIELDNLRNTSTGTTSVGIEAGGQVGIVVDHMTFINDNNPVRMAYTSGSVVRNSSFQQVRGDAAIAMVGTTGGFDTNLVYNNYIETMCNLNSSSCPGPDGIQTGAGLTAYNNTFKEITTSVTTSDQHPDMLQVQGNYIKLYNNEFINVGDSVFDYGYFPNDPNLHDVWVYNNVFRIQQVIDPYPEFFRLYANPGSVASINNFKILNNDFIDNQGGYRVIRFDSFNGSPTGSGNQIENNIFHNDGGGSSYAPIIWIDNSSNFTSTSFTFDHNIYSNTSGTQYVMYRGTSYTTSQWVSAMEPHGSTAHPTFKSYTPLGASNDFHLATSDTVASGAGANFGSIFTTDKDGTLRPSSGAWDDGAYEGGGAPADTTPPSAPSGLTTGNATATSVTLAWTASTDNVGVAGYDVFLNGSKVGTTTSTSNTYTGLSCATSYTLAVDAFDAAGNSSARSTATASTMACDSTPPSVSITAPVGGSTVSGTVTVSANASDNAGVASVQFMLDGTKLGAADGSPPYSAPWNTTAASNGTHTLAAVATDTAGNSTTSGAVTVTVSNATTMPASAASYALDGSGVDASGNGNTLALTATTWVSGKWGSALSFNGSSSIASAPDAPGLDASSGLTLEAWVFPTGSLAGSRSLISKEKSGGGFPYGLALDGGRPTAWLKTSTGNRSVNVTSTVPLNTWSFVAMTYDGSTLRLFMNGTQVASTAANGTIANSTGPLSVGADVQWGEFFQGAIDNVRVYPTGLSTTQLATDMSSPVPPPPAGPTPVAAYSFNAGSGSSAVDASGGGNALTLTSTAWVSGKWGSALSFNGSTSIGSAPDAPSLDASSGLTLEAWVYPTAGFSASESLIAKEKSGGGFPYGLALENGRPTAWLQLSSGANPSTVAASALALNTWSFVAMTYDGSTLRVYVNGVQVASTAASGTIATSTGPLSVGADVQWGEAFQGSIDNVRVYSTALSGAALSTDMSTPVNG